MAEEAPDGYALDRKLAKILDRRVWNPMNSSHELDNRGWSYRTDEAIELASEYNLNIDLSGNQRAVTIVSEKGEWTELYEDHPDVMTAMRIAILWAVIKTIPE